MSQMDSIFEQVKARLRIEDVIEADGWPLTKAGKWRSCTRKGDLGLTVNVQMQYYKWMGYGVGSEIERGDVVQWIQYGGGQHRPVMDVKQAAEIACERAGLPRPVWSQQDTSAHLAQRAKEDALEVATRVFESWFRASEAAQTYARGRGWSLWQDSAPQDAEGAGNAQTPATRKYNSEHDAASTAERARLGYTGTGSPEERKKILKIFEANGVDIESPIAVGVLGYQGDVLSWYSRHGLEISNSDWVERGRIPGMVGSNSLVYPHLVMMRPRYLSTRGLAGKVHYNAPADLFGPRQVYYNHAYTAAADEMIICEGQADAVTWGQWGWGAVALCGVALDAVIDDLRARHKTIYYAYDLDVAGVLAAWRVGKQVGPKLRLISSRDPMRIEFEPPEDAGQRQRESYEQANDYLRAISAQGGYPSELKAYGTYTDAESKPREVKDSNDLLRAMAQTDLDGDYDNQRNLATTLLRKSATYVSAAATWAGAKQGAERETAMLEVVKLINELDDFSASAMVGALSKQMGITLRELERMRKSAKSVVENRPGGDPIYTFGGYFGGYLVEYLYDLETHKAMLAWRTPDGKVEKGGGVTIEGKYYEPYPPDDNLKSGSILFASDLDKKLSIGDLVNYIVMYLKKVYLMPSEETARLVAYWVLTTWVYDSFETVIYLRAMGGAGSGKSELMKRIGQICYRLMTANGAGSTASLFRAVERYKGTVFIDEADLEQSDTEADMVKFYNLGAMRGNPIWRLVEATDPNGNKVFEMVTFQTFCPKLVAMRKDFKDDAIGSRSLTLRLTPREMIELKAAGITLTMTDDIRRRAQALRNLLITWRLYTWQPTIEVNFDFYDLNISPRLNQVAGPLLSIARDDPAQQDAIRETLRRYYQDSIIGQSMTLTARVIEALWTIMKMPDQRMVCAKQEPTGEWIIKIGEITRVANEIIAMMNGEKDDEEDDNKYSSNRKMKSRRVGEIVREELNLQVTERRRDGFWVIWNEPRMLGLSMRFGINPDEFGPQHPENQTIKKIEATQQGLGME